MSPVLRVVTVLSAVLKLCLPDGEHGCFSVGTQSTGLLSETYFELKKRSLHGLKTGFAECDWLAIFLLKSGWPVSTKVGTFPGYTRSSESARRFRREAGNVVKPPSGSNDRAEISREREREVSFLVHCLICCSALPSDGPGTYVNSCCRFAPA